MIEREIWLIPRDQERYTVAVIILKKYHQFNALSKRW